MKYIKTLTAAFFFFLLDPAGAFAQITVILKQPPAYQFKVEHMWKVTLVNPTKTTYTVSLHARATDAVEGLIVDATTTTFTLPPGTKIINPRELVPINIKETNPKYKDVVQNIGGVPSGNYEICVCVINDADGLELGCGCVQALVENLTRVELLEPGDGTVFRQVISEQAPEDTTLEGTDKKKSFRDVSLDDEALERFAVGQFINFNWLPPTPIPPGNRVTYRLRIAEIYGNQSPYDAIRSNPAFFDNSLIISTIYQYPLAARPFESGKRYAWKVDVFLNGVFLQESEIREFGTAKIKARHDIAMNAIRNIGVRNDGDGEERREFSRGHSAERPLLFASTSRGFDAFFIHEMQPGTTTGSGVPPVQFSGQSRFSFSGASRQASFYDIPKNSWTWEINPTLTLFGLPFTSSVLLSSQQESNRQSMNSFGLNFDLSRLQGVLTERLNQKADELEKGGMNAAPDPAEIERLRNPSNLSENLDRYNVASGAERFFMSVRSLGIGTTYPSYSEYTLSGVPVTGLNVEFNPGILYVAFAAMQNQRPLENSSFRRSLYAGRLGLGQKENSHVYFTGLYVKDDVGSIRVDSANTTLTPQKNHVFGTEAKLTFFKNLLTLEGEGAVAVLTRDTRDPELESKSIPGWLKKIVDPRISTSFDYSYSGKLVFNNDASATRISLGIKMVGPGYTSLGVPNLRTDQFGYEGKLDQRLLQRRVSVGAFFRRFNDNLIKWKRSTTTTTAFGINLGLTFPRLPYVRLSYSPYFQKNDDYSPAYKVDNKTSVYSVSTGYSYKLGKLNSSTSLVFSGQDAKTDSGTGDFRTNSFMVTEAISLSIPLSFTATWGLIQNTSAANDSKINNIDIGANAQVTDMWAVTGGFNFAAEQDRNRRTGFYVSSNVSPLKWFGIDLRAERNVYIEEQATSGDYREFILNASLTARW